jgi:hypothetical protein
MSDYEGGKGGNPTPFTNAFDHPQNNSLRYNTAQAGSPIPLIWGCQRCTINLIYAGNLKGGPKSGGGKGGVVGGGKKSGNYTVFVQMGICHGPVSGSGAPGGIFGSNRVWSNGGITSIGNSKLGLNLYAGDDGQPADPAFAGLNPFNPGYSGTAHADGAPMQLGSTPALPDLQFEVTGFRHDTAANLQGQANPGYIIWDILTDPRVGMGLNSSFIDGDAFNSFVVYCDNWGLGMSLIMDRVQAAGRWIEEMLMLTATAAAWTGYSLKFIPYSVIPNGTWQPNITPAYTLTDRDFIPFDTGHIRTSTAGQGTDPITVTRKDHATVTNWISIEYMNWANSYNPDVVPQWIQGLIDSYGVKTEPSIQAHQVTNPQTAAQVAQLVLGRKAFILNEFQFKLPWTYCLLEPMDIVLIEDAGAGVGTFPVRITQIEEDDNGELTIRAEEIQDGYNIIVANQSVVLPSPNVPNVNINSPVIDQYAEPGDANPPLIVSAPAALVGGDSHTIWFVSSGGPNWGGATVWISTDGNSYSPVATVSQGARQGILTSAIGGYGGVNPDITDTLHVDMTESRGQLLSGSASDAANFLTLCAIQDLAGTFEFLSYQTATLVSTGRYNLTTLYRGIYGSSAGPHPQGAKFARLDGTQATYVYPSNLANLLVHIKLTSFNLVGTQQQDLSVVPSYTFTTPP